MANEIIPPNTPLTRALTRVQSTRKAEGTEKSEQPKPKSPRARLNFIPDDAMLAEMINRALQAISRGARWTRGAILNLLV